MFQIQDMLCTVVDLVLEVMAVLVLEAMVVLVLDGVDLVIVDSEAAVAAADSQVVAGESASMNVTTATLKRQHSVTAKVLT
ncbi:hypothetical protein L0F63_001174 [Massospora cicadina]|nr:hypothetical protein L0F63_001174 [Massospora cicadina]